MSDDTTEDKTEDTDEKVEDLIEDTNKEIKDDPTIGELRASHDKLKDEIASLRRDKSKDAEDKSKLEASLATVLERVEHLIQAQEEKDKKVSDTSTIVVPPTNLQPTQQNVDTNANTDGGSTTSGKAKKRRMPWY